MSERNGTENGVIPTAGELAATRAPLLEASQLPPRVYTSEEVAAWEAEHVFLGGWVIAGRAEELAAPGDFFTRELGGESLVFVAGEDGVARGFYNVCRHRGALIVTEAEGHAVRLQCPYHAWVYELDGTLKRAPYSEGMADFDEADFGLTPLRTEVAHGFVWCDPAGDGPPLAEHLGDLAPHLARHRLGELRRAARSSYDVAANWKVIVENYNECYHCPGVHPGFNRVSPHLSGEEVRGAGAWCGGTMDLAPGMETMSSDGRGAAPPIADLPEEDLRRVYYFGVFPNALVSLHPDYAMVHTLWPRGAGRTEVVCEWHYEPAAMAAAGFDPAAAVDFWDTVNRQDWDICERTQKGLGSRGFRRGRFTWREGNVQDFDVLVADAYEGRCTEAPA